MTKDALESLRKRHSKYVSNCYYRDWLLAVACVDEIAAALEQAWAEIEDLKRVGGHLQLPDVEPPEEEVLNKAAMYWELCQHKRSAQWEDPNENP